MKFNDAQPIFLQIADWMCEQILTKEWKPLDRIPSVRDLAVELEVNPNTVMRAYERLQSNDVIYNKRGIGYFLSEEAYQQVLALRRSEFLAQELPKLFKNMNLLGISCADVELEYNRYLSKHNEDEKK